LYVDDLFRKAAAKSVKDSKSRVCNECRHLLVKGASLDGRQWSDNPDDFKQTFMTSGTVTKPSPKSTPKRHATTNDDFDSEYYSDDNSKSEFLSMPSPKSHLHDGRNSEDGTSVNSERPSEVVGEISLHNSFDMEALLNSIIENSPAICYVEALHDYDGKASGSMKFSTGNKMKIIKKGNTWWLAVNQTVQDIGWIPPNFVKETNP
jgi:hypothetical protein